MKKLPVAACLLLTALFPAAGQGPSIRVVNAASNLPDAISPGTIVYILGPNLSNTMASTSDWQNLPVTLGGVTVTANGVPALLGTVGPTSIIAEIDPSTPTGPGTLNVVSPVTNSSVSVNILPVSAPGLFQATSGTVIAGTPGAPSSLTVWATGLDLTTAPVATMGGLPATVQSYGPLDCCAGFEIVTVQVPAGLAGAGRVELVVTSNGMASNAVDAVVLPAGVTTRRNREIGDVIYVPALRVGLVADEADDVIRVIDIKQRAVIRTIALPTGSQPYAMAVDPLGFQAAVVERGRSKLAVIDLQAGVVVAEIPLGSSPSSVAIDGDMVLVANQGDDNVAVISLVRKQTLALIPVGHGPRDITIDPDAFRAYVANENGGTVSVIDLAKRAVAGTIDMGVNARPRWVALDAAAGILAVGQPSAGVVDFFDLFLLHLSTARNAAADLAFHGTSMFLANQNGGSVASFNVSLTGIGLSLADPLKLEPGVRSLAVDSADNLLLVSSESGGKVWLMDLNTGSLVGSINAVRSESETDNVPHDDRTDRDHAANTPAIVSITPREVAAGSTVDLLVNGPNLAGAYNVFFPDPSGMGADTAFTVTAFEVDPSGAQIRMTVQIAPGAAKGDHLLRAFAWNGETSAVASPTNVLTIR